jgi:phosphoserine aminotransferase
MADGGFTRVPAQDEINLNPGASYVHITTNETIEGVEWKQEPEVGDVPLIADASSDILSHRIPFNKYAMIYAGAQKNMGPSGVTLVIVRDDLLQRIPKAFTQCSTIALTPKTSRFTTHQTRGESTSSISSANG